VEIEELGGVGSSVEADSESWSTKVIFHILNFQCQFYESKTLIKTYNLTTK
jgi:hypothetical protein